MSEFISHECGIALVRLKKPLAYYQEKYGTPLWGFYQLFLLMEKQHNRGQDGAGVACVKFDVPVGEPYMFRERNVETNERLAAAGIEVIAISGSELGSGRGGPRCMSCPISRDPL